MKSKISERKVIEAACNVRSLLLGSRRLRQRGVSGTLGIGCEMLSLNLKVLYLTVAGGHGGFCAKFSLTRQFDVITGPPGHHQPDNGIRMSCAGVLRTFVLYQLECSRPCSYSSCFSLSPPP